MTYGLLRQDVTPENGGTCCVPGSHLTGIIPPLEVDFTLKFPTVNFCAKAGTAVVFDGRLWHATGGNVTKDVERPMIFQYCNCPNFRQQENMVGLILFLDPNTTAIEHVLTFHSRHLFYCHRITPKSTRPSLDVRSPSAARRCITRSVCKCKFKIERENGIQSLGCVQF